MAIIHCPGHQKGNNQIAKGNRRADHEARQAAQGLHLLPAQPLLVPAEGDPAEALTYTEQDLLEIDKMGPHSVTPKGIWKNPEGKTILPRKLATVFLKQIHRLTHLGSKHLITSVQRSPYYILDLHTLARLTVDNCKPCQLVNACPNKMPPGKRLRGDRPGSHWEIDFTEIKPGRYGLKYLLVFIDTFSGWVEAFPTKKETARVVVKIILEEIFPRLGVPRTIGSDNGPAFTHR